MFAEMRCNSATVANLHQFSNRGRTTVLRNSGVESLQPFIEMRDSPFDVSNQVRHLGFGQVGRLAEAVVAQRAEKLRPVAHQAPLADLPLCHRQVSAPQPRDGSDAIGWKPVASSGILVSARIRRRT